MDKPAWQREGREPDYRFTLANERTFLAWIRTGLALLAGGVALSQFAPRLGPAWAVGGLALALALVSAVLPVAAYRRWRANEAAMRHARPLPATRLLALLAGGLLMAAAVLAILLSGHLS